MTENTSNEAQAKYSKEGQAALNAILNATSREALQSAIRDATSMSERIPGLSDAIASAKSRIESNIVDANIVQIQHQADAAQTKQPYENIIPDLLKPQETKIDLKDKESVTKFAEEAAKATGKSNLEDGAFGETLKAIKAQEKRDKERVASSARLKKLQEIAEKAKNGESLEGIDAKTLKAAQKVAKLDKGKIKQAREIRKARDNFDDLGYALSDLFDETKPKPKALEDVPDASRASVAEAEKKPIAEASQKEEKPLTLSSLFGGISDDDFEPVAKAASAVKPAEQEQPQPSAVKPAEQEQPQPSLKEPESSKTDSKEASAIEEQQTEKSASKASTNLDNVDISRATHAKPVILDSSVPTETPSVEQSKKLVDKIQQPTVQHKSADPDKMRAMWPPVKPNMSPPPTPDRKAFAPQQVRRRNTPSP